MKRWKPYFIPVNRFLLWNLHTQFWSDQFIAPRHDPVSATAIKACFQHTIRLYLITTLVFDISSTSHPPPLTLMSVVFPLTRVCEVVRGGVRQKFAEGMLIWWVPKRPVYKFFQWSCKFFPWCIKWNNSTWNVAEMLLLRMYSWNTAVRLSAYGTVLRKSEF